MILFYQEGSEALKIIIDKVCMRGIQINNYFNNHITLNGKKVNQESQQVVPHPKTKHLNPNLYQPQSHQLEARPPPVKSHELPPKKRTNTLVELKKHIPAKRSISTDRHRNAVSAKKKEENISNESDKEEEPLVNMSQRKLKPSISKGGLGKRSKSTIIKTAIIQVPKTTVKKENKKFSSNPTDESVKGKTKRKKSSRIVENSKQIKPNRPLTARRDFIPVASKEVPKREKEKFTLTLGKAEHREDKKSILSGRSRVGGAIPKKKESKPVSAREKRPKKSKFIEQLKQKYQNQTILDGQLSHRIKGVEEHSDNQFMSVMNSLEKVLNSVESKEKLKLQLKLISQKLKEFKLESDSDRSKPFQEKERDDNGVQIKIEKMEEGDERVSEEKVEERVESEEEDSEVQEPLRYKIEQVIQNDIPAEHEHEECLEQNPLLDKRNHGFFFEQENLIINNNDDSNDRKKEIEALKKFKNESTKMMEKVGLNNLASETNQEEPSKQKEQIQQMKAAEVLQLVIDNDSNLSKGSGHVMQDKYPVGIVKSPKFDQFQFMGIISLKEQFISNKHDKMSELVKKMFQKQLVSPKSFESQISSLNKRFEDENSVLQSYKKQAEQMSSLLNDIKKDKDQIQGIDELIRNQKWDEARKLVQETRIEEQRKVEEEEEKKKKKVEEEKKREKEIEMKRPKNEGKKLKYSKDQLGIGGWEREEGWERVEIKHEEIENNEFIDIGEKMTRGRLTAQAKIDKVDIDQECGGTEQSVELQADECIYYNSDNDTDEKHESGGIIRLVQISHEEKEDNLSGLQPHCITTGNDNVFHIENEQIKQKSPDASFIEKNNSNGSVLSSQSDRKGFTTNLYFIKEYCIALCEFLRDNDIFKAQFKSNISKPLAFDLPQLFKSLRNDDMTDYFYTERSEKVPISELVWNEFNAQYQTLKFNSSQNKQSDRYNFEKEQELIFIRMIYDVLNQSLDFERPGSQFGKAFPWSESAKHLKNLKQATQPDKDNIEAYDLMFGVAIARIIQWGSCLCGFLPDTVELQNTQIDQPYVNHIRQTRMAFLLQKMMAAEESIMTNFQLQETEMFYKLSHLIAEELLEEAVVQAQAVFQER